MAREDRALRALTRADPVPHEGPAIVRYMGGTGQATRVLSGLDGPPPPALRRTDPERYAEQSRRWRSANRQAQRWAKGQTHKDPQQYLTPAQRRRAQAGNRERKRTAARVAGIRAQVLDTRVVIPSSGRGRTDTRTRSILHDPAGQLGVLVNDPDILQAVLDGDTEAAAELLHAGFVDAAGMPEETELHAASWVLWVDGEPTPGEARR